MRFALLVLSLALVTSAAHLATAQDAGSSDVANAEQARASQTVTIYGHIFGNGEDPDHGINGPMPGNTVYPEGDQLFAIWQNDGCGILPVDDPTGGLGGTVPVGAGEFQGGPDCDKDPINKLIVFLTAGPVQIHSAENFNYSALHNEHGRAKEVYLDPTKDLTAWFYAAADFHSWSLLCPAFYSVAPPDVACPWPSWGWDPGIVPGFVVEAKLMMASLGDYGQGASDPPPIANALANAQVIAAGKTDPVNMQTGLPGSPNAQEFKINLGKPKIDVIPKDQDLFLMYSWYEISPAGTKIGLSNMKPWAGEQFPVRFTLPVKNPFDVELVIPQFVHDKVLVHSVLSSPWGSYDVDVKGVTIDLRGPNGEPILPEHITRTGDYSVAHGAHFKPVNLTWVWDYKADKARPGTYKAIVTGCDLENICGSTEATFTINADGSGGDYTIGRSGQQTASQGQLVAITGGEAGNSTLRAAGTGASRAVPGPEALLGVAVLGLAAVALRRKP